MILKRNALRNLLLHPAPNCDQETQSKEETKDKQLERDPANQSEANTTDSESESNDEAEIQTPKRKWLSDYIAKNPEKWQ